MCGFGHWLDPFKSSNLDLSALQIFSKSVIEFETNLLTGVEKQKISLYFSGQKESLSTGRNEKMFLANCPIMVRNLYGTRFR